MINHNGLRCPKHIICLRALFAVLIISVAAFIFYMSAQDAATSSKTSGDFIEKIVSALDSTHKTKSYNEKRQIISSLQKFVRKLAHFSIFSLLGVFTASFFSTFKKGFWGKFLFSQLFCSIYAISDEIHQKFVIGRSCEIKDMLIDSAGSFCGIFLVLSIVTLCIKRKEVKKLCEKK